FGGFVYAPFHACKRSRCIENILAVVQVKDGVTPSGEMAVAMWQINQNITPVPEDLRRKSAVPFDVSSKCILGHGKTRRLPEDQLQRKPQLHRSSNRVRYRACDLACPPPRWTGCFR